MEGRRNRQTRRPEEDFLKDDDKDLDSFAAALLGAFSDLSDDAHPQKRSDYEAYTVEVAGSISAAPTAHNRSPLLDSEGNA